MSISAVTASDDINATNSVLTDSNDNVELNEINNQPRDIEDEDSISEDKKISTTQDDETKCMTIDSTSKINKSKSKIGADENLNIDTTKSQKNTFEDLDDEKIKSSTVDANSNIISLNNEDKQVKSNISADIDATLQNLETKIHDTIVKIKSITDNLEPGKLSELNDTLIDLKDNIEKTISEAKEKYKNSMYEKEVMTLLEVFSKRINNSISEIQNNISNAKGNFEEIKTGTLKRVERFISEVNSGIKFINDIKEAIKPLFKNNNETKQNSASTTASTSKTKTKTKVSLTLKNIKTLSKNAKKLVITAKLKIDGKIAKNKNVIFIFKGKKYVRKTNKNGIATLTLKKATIKKLLKKVKLGKKVTYQVKYNKNTVKKSFKVKK